MLAALAAAQQDNEEGDDEKSRPLPEAVAMTLRERFDAISKVEDFAPGDIIVQKDGLKAYTIENDLAVVVRLVDMPPEINGSTWPPRDIIIGFVDEDGDFMEHFADKRRFKKLSPSE
jgi:hypothetical protein